jgi:uncharacterized protein YjbJ (UPF0337 family)
MMRDEKMAIVFRDGAAEQATPLALPLAPGMAVASISGGRTTSKKRRFAMNWDVIQGKWQEFAGKFKSKWAKLTDDDWKMVAGKKDQLVGKLQERYGYTKDQAEKEVDEFIKSL